MREPYALADVDRVDSLEAAIALMGDGSHSHSIAWLDLLAPGAAFARGVVTRSREGSQRAAPGALRSAPRPPLRVPARLPGGLLRPSTIRLFNAALWLRSRRRVRGRPLGIAQQLFPLDRVSDWNRLYGPAGLLQYQFAVPTGSEAALRGVLELLRRERLGMYLAALKRFGPSSGGMLSFPIEGWTLAVDLPAGTPGVRAALDRADEVVTSVGGRVYLAKDARMRPEALPAMYQRLPRFIEVRAQADPDGVLRSDLGRRLGLSG
jgi:decaprenylphospho-beta-D-ribofuranose 2-oxidase